MALTLTIENEQSLSNGAPVSVRLTDRRGLDIGRSANSEWSLPDPTRFISGRHCEVRYRDGGYWLNDLSTNGTFLNDSVRRIQAPYRLRHGDRLTIGSYVIVIAIEDETGADAFAPRATTAAALAPMEPGVAADISAQIAHAIAVETAPSSRQTASGLDTAPPLPETSVPASVDAASGADRFSAPASDPAGPGAKPFTMVRARGFFAAEPQGRDPADLSPRQWNGRGQDHDEDPAADAPAFEALWPDALAQDDASDTEEPAAAPENTGEQDPRLQEAIAWSAAQREGPPPDASPPPDAPPQAALFETQPAPDLGPAPDWAPAPAGPTQSVDPEIRDAAAPAAPRPAPNEAAPIAATGPTAEEFLRAFAKGAGIPDHIFARQNSLKVAEELGALMRLAVEDLTQLLSARFKAKRFARTSSQTMIQALDNNPLKFAPTAEDALKIMFGPRTSGYLDARRAFEGAFTDLKTHQVTTFAAMQQAVRMLVEDLDPKSIEEACGKDTGLAALFGARKTRLWDLYLARWQAKTLRHEDGLVDAFMLYFAQCYDQSKDAT